MNTAASSPTRFGYQHVQDRLLERRQELADRVRRVRRDLTHQNDPLVADFADQALQRQNDEPLQVIGAAAREELEQIDAALARLAAGTYETCEICGEAIDATRHAVVPYARTCAECALDVAE